MGLFRRTGKGSDPVSETRNRRMLPRNRGNLYADDPVDEVNDQLDRGRLAAQLTRSIEAVSNQSDSAVVALVGPWGSGKSSLLIGIEANLREEGWYLARHNPWAYSSYERSVAGFFAEIRDVVPDAVMGPDRRRALGEWVERLAPAGTLGTAVGVNATGAMTSAASLIMGDRSPERLRKIFAEALEGLDHPVLVILDDLDRLQPDELLLTFKLVRLIGRLPNVYYLLAYDEATLAEVLQHTQLIGSGPGRARQYLEKMVQVRLDIPPLLEDQQINLVNEGIDAFCAAHGVELAPDARARLQSAWSECLVRYLDQPRAVKRLFTQVDALWPEVHGEVDFVDFLLMTFLRTFERDVHELVINHKSELLQSSFAFGRHSETNPERWERWKNRIAEEGKPRHVESIAALMSELFLYLRGARENTSYAASYREDVRRRRGVDSDEFFDRYTQVGVPASDLAEKLVADAVNEMRAGAFGPSIERLQSWFDKDAGKVARKLYRVDEQSPLPTGLALSLLGRNYLPSSDQRSGILGLRGDREILRVATRIVLRLDGDDALTTLHALAVRGTSELAMAADVVRMAKRADSGPPPTWLFDGVQAVSSLVEKHLRAASQEALTEAPDLPRFLYTFLELQGSAATQALLWGVLESSSWQLEDLLASLVPVGQTSNGRRTWQSLGELRVGDVDELLNIARVLAALPSTAGEQPIDEDDEVDVTFEGRRRYALRVMERVRAERSTAEPEAAP
ncbi:P-loop NTPase fold protein [Asanoa sp. WMMD1127]|uniref:KAP family P-loop NTPase fold protein n=1 Tax=Asanoa sp. WMMD1127 TaxID=3016107 RepID=UPI00241600B1|nr:P-loop NTPase fold protein [Asanoa sp. WMMD1127]MDG4823279.1 P-loop NTPase fold protein [Asanoa sp. WMMD1127]